MRSKLPIVLSAAALVVAVLGASSPAIAHGVQHALFAHKAGKVDGRSAVGPGATRNAAAGKLVATRGSGPHKGTFAPKFIPGGTARGYAFVTKGGPTLRSEYSKGFSAVERIATGKYCLRTASGSGLDPTKHPLLVSVEWDTSLGFDLLAFWRVNNGECDPNEYLVYTYEIEGGMALSNEVSFVAFVP